MRNVAVVLVPLCFGLASGFIVPSGIQEIITDLKVSVNSVHSSARKTRNILSAGTSTIPSPTEKAVNGSLNTDLYEHSQTKESDVKERAYIYIKQNGSKSIRNRLYDSPIPQNSNAHKSYLFNIKVFEELPRQFWIGYMSQQTNTEPNKLQCHTMENKNQKKFDTIFLDPMKAPLLRPGCKSNKRLDQDQFKYVTADLDSFVLNPSEIRSLKPDLSKNIGNIKGKVREEVVSLDKIGQKNYLSNDKSLLDELIKQKLNEHGSLFGCRDCSNALSTVKKNKLSNRILLEAIRKCGSNLLPREVEKSKQ
ncbi:uncharacterized protein LOC123875061 [Maniola jurtina]|uniref:uncharacterized protein LOC123875061 n=1 Tax=Maniola jurtina TaxID=191418 RepID=UPI001E686013|nr:uncharacterized protein LOC123875061 [Maniola jurtina]